MPSRARRTKALLNAGIFGVTMAAVLAPASASAQGDGSTNTARENAGVAEIIVTATMRKENVQDTPVAITAITGDLLAERSQTSIYEVAKQAPNVSLAPQGQGYGSTMLAFIRGVGQSDFILALEPGVGIYVDDVYYSTLTGSLVDLLDVDRVEVLRGPQGTLSGRNSIGGSIKMFSKKPTGDGSGSVSITAGSNERVDGRAVADFAIVPDKLNARISVVGKSGGAYVKRVDYACAHPDSGVPSYASGEEDCVVGTLGGKSLVAGRLYLDWTISDDIDVELIGDITRDRSEAGADVLRYANNPRLSIDDGNSATPIVPYDCRFVAYGTNSCDSAGSDPYRTYATFLDPSAPTSQSPYSPYSIAPISHLDSVGLSGKVTWRLSDNLELMSISAFRRLEANFAEDVDGSPIAGQLAFQTVKNKQWSQEVRLSAKLLDDRLDLTGGGFWFKSEGEFSARFDLRYIGLDFIQGPEYTPSRSTAAFLNGSLRLTDSLRFSGGVRYSWDKKDQTYARHNPDGTVPTTFCLPGLAPFDPANAPNCALVGLDGLEDGYKGERFDWRAALDLRASDQVMFYGQIATGYRGGGVNPRPFFGPGTVLPIFQGQIDPVNGVPTDVNQLKSFKPETMTSFELGIKTDLLDRRLRINVAAFYNDYRDIILNSTACPISPCYQPNNIGKAEVKGAEIEVAFYPTERLSFDMAASYLDFQYKDTDQATTGIALNMVTPFTPEYKISGGVQYDIVDSDAGRLSLRVDGSYQSEVYTEAMNGPTNRIDGYFLANARLVWTAPDNDWSAALEVTNLSDKYYELTRFDQAVQAGSVSATPGGPRQWAITLTKSF